MTALLRNHAVWIVLVTLAVLLLPFITMQFNDQVAWDGVDFVVAGALLLATGFTLDAILTKLHSRKRKVLAIAALGLALLYIWAELAVGVFTHLGS